MSKNMERFGSTLANRMKKTANGAVKITTELGTINSNLSLTPDSLQAAIPKGDYMVNIMLTGGNRTSTETIEDADHSHQLPASFRNLQAGDRVLMTWCGNEPVVLAIVVSS
jgi:hypothetical protein